MHDDHSVSHILISISFFRYILFLLGMTDTVVANELVAMDTEADMEPHLSSHMMIDIEDLGAL